MKIQVYNPDTLSLEQDSATGIDFGTVFQGNHSESAVVVRPVATTENNFLQMQLFLQSVGGFTNSSFGYYKNSTLSAGISAGSNFLSDHFTVNTSPTVTGLYGVPLTAANPEYVWMDVQTGDREAGSTSTVNYQFSFEYN